MPLNTPKSIAYRQLSKLAQIKVDMDAHATMEAKFAAAIERGYLPIVNYFLENQFTPQSILRDSKSAIEIAIRSRASTSASCLQLLLTKNFDPKFVNAEGKNALHHIAERLNLYITLGLLYSRGLEIFKLFLKAGCDLEQLDNNNQSPLNLIQETAGHEEINRRRKWVLTKLDTAIKEVHLQYQPTHLVVESLDPNFIFLSEADREQVSLYQNGCYGDFKRVNRIIFFSAASASNDSPKVSRELEASSPAQP